ncbi:MAG: hypothetical protein O3A46_13470 [Candidatus Poribacteria bacterium]|nr:hypothetical protein [Candidatus Poribacteria bacterium]
MSRFITPTMRKRIEWGAIILALSGIALMMQPFTQTLFLPGFWLLLVAGIVYVGTTFWRPERLSWTRALTVIGIVFVVLILILTLSVALVPVML